MAPRAASIWSSLRMVVHVQDTIHLRQVPTETAGQFCLADTLIPHSLVQHHLDGGEGRQWDTNLAVRGHRNVLSSVDARGDRFVERPDRALNRLGSIVPERRQFGKIRSRNEYGPVIMFQRDWITQHVSESSSQKPDTTHLFTSTQVFCVVRLPDAGCGGSYAPSRSPEAQRVADAFLETYRDSSPESS